MMIIVACLLLFCLLNAFIKTKHYYFHCPYCHHEWKPRFFQTFGNVNCYVNQYHVQCPHCHQIQNIQIKNKKRG